MKAVNSITLAVLVIVLSVPFATAPSPAQEWGAPSYTRLVQAGTPQSAAIVGSISGSWRIEALHNGRGRLVRIAADLSAITQIDIQPQGRWSAYIGCNRMSGRLFQRGETIEVDDTIISTKMSCPGDVGDFEQRFAKAFSAANRVQQHGGRITLSDRLGRNLMVLTQG